MKRTPHSTASMAQCPCRQPGAKTCHEKLQAKRSELFRRDIDDITDSVMQVMRICGLKGWEVRRTKEVIKRSFQHYDEVRFRIDRVPRKRFRKETFMHALSAEAQLSRMDAQITYSIVKRAFKAYYHGTAMEGKRLKTLMENMKHSQECLWLHAAKRTAEIYATYAGLMHSEMLLFAERFECVYKGLYDALCTRVYWDDEKNCRCDRIASNQSQTTVSAFTAEIEVLFQQRNMAPSSAPSAADVVPSKVSVQVTEVIVAVEPPTVPVSEASSKSSRFNYGLKTVDQKPSSSKPSLSKPLSSKPLSSKPPTTQSSNRSLRRRRIKCTCPKMQCDRLFAREAPEITAECSQGPYVCRWLPYDEEQEQFKEHRVPFPPMEVICPPCEDEPCDPECTCTCDVCTCPPAYGMEEEHGEKVSATGIEDHDTDYCWLAPFRNWPRVDDESEEEELEEEAGETLGFEEEFTFWAPFRPIPPVGKEVKPVPPVKKPEKVEEESTTEEDPLAKPPPRGVSLDTYRCWLLPTPTPSQSESITEEELHGSYVQVMSQAEKPEVANVSASVSVKEQHHERASQVAKAPGPAAKTPRKSSLKTPTIRISIKTQAAAAPKAPLKPRPSGTTPAAPPAPAPPAVKPPSIQNPAPGHQEGTLTKDDIMNIIGF